MSIPKIRPVIIMLLSGVLLISGISACNLPRKSRTTPTPSEFEMIGTQAAETVMAQLTQVNKPPVTPAGPGGLPTTSVNLPIVSGPDATITPTTAILPTFTLPQASGQCDRAKYVEDVSVPDNTSFAPGEAFVKTWRLQNSGTCTWTSAYALIFIGGNKMGALDVIPLAVDVPPGSTVDLSVAMQAPNTAGTHRGEWMLRNPAGQVFGTGNNNDLPIWVQIKVAGGGGAVLDAFDFVSNADSASWYSGVAPNLPGMPLTFGGTTDNPNGVAAVADQVILENGAVSGKLLLMAPFSQIDGYVYGVFPAFIIQEGDLFRARLGFAANPDGTCGAGKAIFQLAYLDGADVKVVKQWNKTCNGQMLQVEVDLSSLAGKSVQFILAVVADGSPQDDVVVWNSPIILR
jgi:hypothetical protein